MIKKIALSSLLFIVTVLLMAGVFLYWGIYFPKDSGGEEQLFLINTGDSLSIVAQKLEEKGVIKSEYFFILYGLLTEDGRRIRPGNYKLSSSMNVIEIMSHVVSGGEDRIIIIEGWNMRDIAEYLERNGYGEKEEFFKVAGYPTLYRDGVITSPREGSLINEEIGILSEIKEGMPLEGFLFPDTYFIVPGTSIEDIVRSLVLNFEKRLTEEIRNEIRNSEFSFYEIITIASLIEKEVTDYEEKRIVSGIIRKRLDGGMRLQLDATVTYLTEKRSVDVSTRETRINSPYNTYYYNGLPVGPICNPGIESIRATLNPKETDFLYYLSKPTGETVFSKNFQEHVAAKERYLR
jgi:UPF0755 protein